jgi:hypothetical protein
MKTATQLQERLENGLTLTGVRSVATARALNSGITVSVRVRNGAYETIDGGATDLNPGYVPCTREAALELLAACTAVV